MNIGRKWDLILYSVLNIEVKPAKIQHAKHNIVYLITELYTPKSYLWSYPGQ